MKTADIKVDLIGHYGNDLSVVNAARVSFHKEALEMGEGDSKLIHYLAKHKHHSPFNHAFLSFRVKAPIFVARQLVKHKFLPWNEVSRRYVDDEPEFYFTEDFRKKADNAKQGSSCELVSLLEMVDLGSGERWADSPGSQLALNSEYSFHLYKTMLAAGICPEQARMVLPLNTMTEWVWSGTLGAFLDMLVLRLDPHTQAETRIVASFIGLEVIKLFPISYGAYINVPNHV